MSSSFLELCNNVLTVHEINETFENLNVVVMCNDGKASNYYFEKLYSWEGLKC